MPGLTYEDKRCLTKIRTDCLLVSAGIGGKDRSIEIASSLSPGGKFVLALRCLIASFEEEFNNYLYKELEDRGIEYVADFNFAGLVQNLARRLGFKGDNLEDAVQDTISYLFVEREFLDKFDAERGEFVKFFYTAVNNRLKNYLRDTSKQKGLGFPAGEEPLKYIQVDVEDVLEEMDLAMLKEKTEDALGKHPHGELLKQIWELLTVGWKPKEIAEELEFSPSRLSYYLNQLRVVVRSVLNMPEEEGAAEAGGYGGFQL